MIDYSKLKQLREQTGVSFSLCRKALEESDNDIGKAIKKLNEWGHTKAKEKEGKATSEGGIFTYVHHTKKIAGVVELQCETDFVASNEEFQKLGNEIAMQVASLNPKDAKTLLKQEYVRDPGRTIEDLIKESVLKFGENIRLGRIFRLELGL